MRIKNQLLATYIIRIINTKSPSTNGWGSLGLIVVYQTLISTETPLGNSSFIKASTTCDVEE